MEPLLMTPEYISKHQLIPYCTESIRRLVRSGQIPAVRRQGKRILIHRDDLEAYALQFRAGHTADVAGPHASTEKKEGVCRGKQKKGSTKGKTRHTGGQHTRQATGDELGALLGYQ